MKSAFQQIENKIASLHQAISTINQWKQENKQVVFTNGCFDLLHKGHLHYLCEAASLGHKLILGVNTDSSVKRLKGDERPINNEQTRALMLASFFFVDLVILFEEDTPEKLISALSPNILVKGGDYSINEIVGADFVLSKGGKVLALKFVDGFSSSSIIHKIKKTSS